MILMRNINVIYNVMAKYNTMIFQYNILCIDILCNTILMCIIKY